MMSVPALRTALAMSSDPSLTTRLSLGCAQLDSALGGGVRRAGRAAAAPGVRRWAEAAAGEAAAGEAERPSEQRPASWGRSLVLSYPLSLLANCL